MILHELRRQIRLPLSPEKVFEWHSRKDALLRLSPPWAMPVHLRQQSGLKTGGQVSMRIPLGPLSLPWKGYYPEVSAPFFFKDIQTKGPFAFWEHSHYFHPDAAGCRMEDILRFALPAGPAGNFFAAKMVKEKLEKLFHWRQHVLEDDLSAPLPRPMTILMSGSSGLVAESLIPALTTAGHRVIPLVRQRGISGTRFWNPEKGCADPDIMDGVDAVLHLGGEPIGEDTWTEEKKRRILQSRIQGTRFLVQAIKKASHPPKILISASAIGYYGHRKDSVLSEADSSGQGFLARVCRMWEEEALQAQDFCRVVCLRIGIGLTPRGGALARLYPLFSMGLGGTIGRGRAWMSWIAMEDLVRAIRFLLHAEEISGPVNLTAPQPLQARAFADTLGSTLKRPSGMQLPPSLLHLCLGEMGKEVLMSSTRAYPFKLEAAGFRFRYPDLKSALPMLTGKG
ncbi:TIGR01777 family oxidoreductase [Desulfobotulus mexicanus]|uniref:TIGR01777 family protein n=1 Tax=Desulfobotulus mexicanus TaxID=2586642 RepID=A0A5S5MCC8_9BACT|nr:TIGR01777 family oxidoreductase [Desulfobotulus mexicanus]TYT73373.1 TIGR01777 family protein [Desulfobotulus mexicanus]